MLGFLGITRFRLCLSDADKRLSAAIVIFNRPGRGKGFGFG